MDDRITRHGFTRWIRTEPRPHHLNLLIRYLRQTFRACLLTPAPETWTSYVSMSDGWGMRDNGDVFVGGMEEAIVAALATVVGVTERREMIEGRIDVQTSA